LSTGFELYQFQLGYVRRVSILLSIPMLHKYQNEFSMHATGLEKDRKTVTNKKGRKTCFFEGRLHKWGHVYTNLHSKEHFGN
jgi:hypothetical protein